MAKQETPKTLEPYLSSGLDLDWSDGEEAIGECPFCSKPKFSVNIKKGTYRCWSCATGTNKGGGNAETLMEKLWDAFDEDTKDYGRLASLRNLDASTLMQWGACFSYLRHCWMIPGYNIQGKVRQLYRYVKIKGKRRLLGTKGLSHGLFGVGLFDKSKHTTYICEGPWDAMALWEVLSQSRFDVTGEKLEITHNIGGSLLADANVLAVPGCNVFKPRWSKLFDGQEVFLCYDNDHPLKNPKTGKVIKPGALLGLELVAKTLNKPKSIDYLHWGAGGDTYHNLGLNNGYDLCDAIGRGKTSPLRGLAARIEGLQGLGPLWAPIPNAWLKSGQNGHSNGSTQNKVEYTPCSTYRELINSWRKALKWTNGLDHALAVMLSTVASTNAMGDQLWIKVIGPAASGKSTLCEAFSVNKEHVYSKSTIRGFHSGHKSADGDGRDVSLINQVQNKTLVTKDGDTLLQSPNLGQILSEARDVYDRTSRTHYRNDVGRDYENINMTWILAGTSSLRSIDSSELGERFLDCVLMDEIDLEMEKDILWRVVNRADRNMGLESGADGQQQEPELQAAMLHTAGYIDFLKEGTADGLMGVTPSKAAKRRIVDLALFVAYGRARPSKLQSESVEREFGARLVSQHMRLSKCLAYVLNKKTIDDEVLARVRQVSLDTARGKTLEIIKMVYEYPEGLNARAIAIQSNVGYSETLKLLQFLRGIKVIKLQRVKDSTGKVVQRWVLTRELHNLYKSVMGI